ncbi:MAG: 1-acyl-sn-glycerol-3-phosphate acyltransferase [Candidatus Binatia bacterium]
MLRWVARYRIEGVEAARKEYRRIRSTHRGPLLICANHLTLIDSALVAWALGSSFTYLRDYAALPWNVPEAKNFAASYVQWITTYVMKCLPITRGGDRAEISRVLTEFSELLSWGEVGLVFPEAGRSRTGRIDVDLAAAGVGRIVNALPGCKVLCVYLRGRGQETFGDVPARGERFTVDLRFIAPKSEHRGLRGSREVSQQILGELADMERAHFAGLSRASRGHEGQRPES